MCINILYMLAFASAFEEGAAITGDLVEKEPRPECIFQNANLFDHRGHPVSCAALAGKSVALYFAGEWCPLCRTFTPALQHFYAQYKDVIEIIFISSDDSEAEAKKHYLHQIAGEGTDLEARIRKLQGSRALENHSSKPPARAQTAWLSLGYGDPLADELKRKHRVWSGRETSKFGFRRRSGVPCVVVIKPDGEEASFIQGERFGAAALREWEPDSRSAWPLKEEM